jgi:hypothetical protein
VPYTPISANVTKAKKSFFGSSKKTMEQNQLVQDAFSESRIQLSQRVDVILSGVARTGVRAVQLGTE